MKIYTPFAVKFIENTMKLKYVYSMDIKHKIDGKHVNTQQYD